MAGEVKISELIDDIKKGILILPEFQRGYTWNRQQVRSYLASLYREYPTGSFLIWKTPEPQKIRGTFAEGDIKFFQLILDGQQRLTSIYTLMEGTAPPFYEGEELYFNLHFNVLTEEFVYYKPSQMKGKVEWLPITKFFQMGLGTFLKGDGPLTPEQRAFYMDNFDQLTALENIRNYLYYLKTVTEPDMQKVVDIFNLVNSSGTRLSKSDLALAHLCASWPEARQTFKDAQKKFASHRFRFDLDFFTRCTATVATGSALYEPLYQAKIEEVQAAWVRVEPVLEYLINLLQHEAYIDSSENLQTDLVLVPLVTYLANGNGQFDNEAEKTLFLHWMYAAMMWARYSASTDTKLQADILALNSEDPPERLRANILADRGRIKVEARDLEAASVRSPFYKMTYIVARSREAKDWFNGLQLYSTNLGKSFGLEDHHIFPQSVLYKSGYNPNDRNDKSIVNEIANLAFLTKKANLKISASDPARYLNDVKKKYPGALEAQLVPTTEALWGASQYEVFLSKRRELIAEAINAFMEHLAGGRKASTPSIEDYIAMGEGKTLEFKSSLRYDHATKQANVALEKSVARTLAAFLNSEGGTLVVGVADEGQVLGLRGDLKTLGKKQNLDGWELKLTDILNHYLSKDIRPFIELSFATIGDETVAVLAVEPHMKPVFVEDGAATELFVRSGNSTQQLNIKEANDYIKHHWK